MSGSLADIAAHVASTPVLLVATDFDGTLADLVLRPGDAAPRPDAMQALAALAATPSTSVAIVSGRSLADLRTRLSDPPGWTLSGSHGAEIDGRLDPALDPVQADAIDRVDAELRAIAEGHPGCLVDRKPRGVAFHYRGLADAETGRIVSRVASLAPQHPGLTMRLGSMVVEFLADRTTKGDALQRLRHGAGATAVIFVGDDLTDEHAFRALSPSDASVKVGPGASVAAFRVAGVDEVVRLLQALAEARRAWAERRRLVPINAHAVLSDQRTVALVAPGARISWYCVPRIDSPPIFAELLGGPASGFFEVAPESSSAAPTAAYDGATLVLRTTWDSCVVTDYLDCGGGRAFQRPGRSDLVRVIEGSGRCRIRFAPRIDFGRVRTRLRRRDHGLEVEGASDPLLLHAPGIPWVITDEGGHDSAEAVVDLREGPRVLELRSGSSNDRAHAVPEAGRRESTKRFWTSWVESLHLPAVAPEVVQRSALMLRALVHGPSGAIAAAATTSLPEHLGGQRNWDYRYCWPRDAAMAAAALVRLGNTGTAMRFLDWLARVLDGCESPGRLRPIYAVDGRDLGPEAEIGGVHGYGGSRPVRVGNAAALQVQLDVFGPIADLLALLAEHGAPISPEQWRMTRAMVEAVEARWQEPDHGIWESRGERRHHVHTKAMCFHAVDRALVVHDAVIGGGHDGWILLRERLRREVLERGYRPSIASFSATYEDDGLDAAALCVGLTGLVDPHDDRFAGTVAAVERHLVHRNAVRRTTRDDGLPGPDGAFHLCTGWLIEAHARRGDLDRARELLDALLGAAGPTGTISEEIDAETGMALGNAPQAYAHLAVIRAAVCIDRCMAGMAGIAAAAATHPHASGTRGDRP